MPLQMEPVKDRVDGPIYARRVDQAAQGAGAPPDLHEHPPSITWLVGNQASSGAASRLTRLAPLDFVRRPHLPPRVLGAELFLHFPRLDPVRPPHLPPRALRKSQHTRELAQVSLRLFAHARRGLPPALHKACQGIPPRRSACASSPPPPRTPFHARPAGPPNPPARPEHDLPISGKRSPAQLAGAKSARLRAE